MCSTISQHTYGKSFKAKDCLSLGKFSCLAEDRAYGRMSLLSQVLICKAYHQTECS